MSICDDYLTACATPEDNRLWGVTVTIRRGSQSTASVTAVWQRPAADSIDSEGLATDYEAREWVIAQASYVFGSATDPRAGDRIVDADGTWQVLPDDGKPAWRPDGSDWVIRTKRVS
jgi:hypothetical protein